MWLALVTAFDVRFVIWPSQTKVPGIAAAGRLAGTTSRVQGAMLPIPMLLLPGRRTFCENGGGRVRLVAADQVIAPPRPMELWRKPRIVKVRTH